MFKIQALYLLVYLLLNRDFLCSSSFSDPKKDSRSNCSNATHLTDEILYYEDLAYPPFPVKLIQTNKILDYFLPLEIQKCFIDLNSDQKNKIISTMIKILSNPRLEEYLTEPEELVSMQPKERMMFKLKRFIWR